LVKHLLSTAHQHIAAVVAAELVMVLVVPVQLVAQVAAVTVAELAAETQVKQAQSTLAAVAAAVQLGHQPTAAQAALVWLLFDMQILLQTSLQFLVD
jgi:hypothetical protein